MIVQRNKRSFTCGTQERLNREGVFELGIEALLSLDKWSEKEHVFLV